uniref:Uncharacterized protein n=1 Tax=Zea mays TaxID=4577 RepID=A0A804PZH2_MAIZE
MISAPETNSPDHSSFSTRRVVACSTAPNAGTSGCSALSTVKQGDLMVVGDSRVVLGTTFDDDAITSSSSSST